MSPHEITSPGLGAPCADAHAHLCMLDDPVAVLVRAARAGVDTIVTIAYPSDPEEFATIEQMPVWTADARKALAEEGLDAPKVVLAVGCHPHEASTWGHEAEMLLRGLLGCGGTAAIGETGLDFHYDRSPRELQRTAFREHLRLAHELDKPVIVHLREAHDEGADILAEEGVPKAGCVIHCFGEGPALAERFVEMGCHISFAGTVTFKKAETIREAARAVPLDRLMAETDCPFLAPEPHRGRKNEPALVTWVVESLARARDEDPVQTAAATRANTRDLFRIAEPRP